MDKLYTKISKFLSLVLRHQLEAVRLVLDAQGWVVIDVLTACGVDK
jgi:putative RNA 2'-phosphotransferase